MEDTRRPDLNLAEKVLPAPLFSALVHLYQTGLSDCVLVGGTALSGFYAGHRRSDDLNFYTKDPGSFKSATLAAKQLAQRGAEIQPQQSTGLYYRAVCRMDRFSFTIDVVQDPAFFNVGQWHRAGHRISVASLSTLLMCKAATLVSRASEKDLYDLIWLFDHFPGLNLEHLIRLGQKIDAGLSAESVLLSLSGAILREDACDFLLNPGTSRKRVYLQIQSFRKQLIAQLKDFRKVKAPPGLTEIVRRIKKITK